MKRKHSNHDDINTRGQEHRRQGENIIPRGETSAPGRKHRPETRNIGARKKTSSRNQEHRRQEENIVPKPETSAPGRKHRPETRNIGAREKTSSREEKHRRQEENIVPRPGASFSLHSDVYDRALLVKMVLE
ncbi:hypothetical protein ACW2QC_17455 [Virgibacillus sp. FSP13]